MSDKSNANGEPTVLFLEDALTEKWGAGRARVICPITDPFVRHHGALGSFVRVYVSDEDDVDDMIRFCRTLSEVKLAEAVQKASEELELRPDREGDIVVISEKNAVIGSRKDEHDLSNLGNHRLRSHGGLSEQHIPLVLSVPLRREAGDHRGRNFDAFDIALNFDAE